MAKNTNNQPICDYCGKLTGSWWQPLITTENFCSLKCCQNYVHESELATRSDCQLKATLYDINGDLLEICEGPNLLVLYNCYISHNTDAVYVHIESI